MKQRTVYFPGLNGLRAISAIAVVVSHITQQLKDFHLNPYIFGTLPNGDPKGLILADYGVSVFFVLSGFLITYLLQAEKDIQPINIKKFYIRRILRIWPLYYLYLFLFIITMVIAKVHLNIKAIFLYIFYAANIPVILRIQMPFIAHYWSLGVEEQFYAFWPWFNKKINKHIESIIITLIICIIGTKICLHYFFPIHFIYPNVLLETVIHITRFHCMMIGALGAILYKRNNKVFLKIIDNKVLQSICWFIILLAAVNNFHVANVIDNEIISVVALILIIGQIRIKNRILNLEKNIFDFLGKISYGIYVIHPLLIFLFSKILGRLNIEAFAKYLIVYTVIIGMTILLAYLSYTYFEKYFLTLKKNYTVVKSSPAKIPLS